jgi:integrase
MSTTVIPLLAHVDRSESDLEHVKRALGLQYRSPGRSVGGISINGRNAAKLQARQGPQSLAELLYRFSQTPEMRTQSEETARQVRRLINRIHSQFGSLSIPEVERPDFRARVYDWRDEMADTPAECERTIRLMSRCIAWGVDRGLVRENRIEGLRYRWRTDARLRADIIWTPQQIEQIRPHLGEIADAFELSLWSGLRQGDVLNLKQDAIDEEGWLHVTPQKTAVATGITVHLPTRLIEPLDVLLTRLRSGDEYVLPLRCHQRSVRRLFDKAKEAAGLGECDLHWHDLRGTIATWLFEAGCTQTEAAAVIGHAPAEGMTKRYAAQSRVYTEHAFTKLNAYLREDLSEFLNASIAACRG